MIAALGSKTPSIADGCFIATNATVLGDVAMGEGASVWFGAVVRADAGPIRIGRASNVQDLCVLHVDHEHGLTIGDEVTVGHRAILHGCAIGDRVLVGMGAVVMNGASVGDECIVGAGALVTEGAQIPKRSLVLGVPAKVVRALTPDERTAIRASAEVYARGAALYAATSLAARSGEA